MSKIVNVEVPDIGDFTDVDIIEVLVSAGDVIAKEDPLITLESDKASIEIPSPAAGTVKEVLVSLNNSVNKGDLILKLEVSETETPTETKTETAVKTDTKTVTDTAPVASTFNGDSDLHAEVVVLGSGPGGYTAAFRAADLGKEVILIEKYNSIGGVCLNVGCIPSKALLHTAEIINEAAEMADHGIDFGTPKIDIKKLAGF